MRYLVNRANYSKTATTVQALSGDYFVCGARQNESIYRDDALNGAQNKKAWGSPKPLIFKAIFNNSW
jgi:hypothetical protein